MKKQVELDNKVDALEMEMLNPSTSGTTKKTSTADSSEPGLFDEGGPYHEHYLYAKERLDVAISLAKLYYALYPKIFIAANCVVMVILIKLLFFRHAHQLRYVPPHLIHHFGNVEAYYDLQVSKIDHWCLHGGDVDCDCNDPTIALSREEVNGWAQTHFDNVKMAKKVPPNQELDVVLLGDQFIQGLNGKFLNEFYEGGTEVQKYFNKTFHKKEGGIVEGLAMGISGDQMTNLLWRMKHGEMPANLNPKVWWLLIGANDLTVNQCSEEAVTLGILRLADEIAMAKPNSIVVLQGLLPRSSFRDGHVRGNHTTRHWGRDREFYDTDRYPLWPAMRAVNNELETFCERHAKVVFFDAADVFFGSLGNEHYQASQKILIKELYMHDFATPSKEGFKVLINVISKEVARIVKGNVKNYKATSADTAN